MDEEPKRAIGVIGIGPIGGILAAHLAKAGEDVVVVDILEGHLEEIRNNSLRISGVVDIEARISKTCLSISELQDHDLDYLFVSVKAPVLPRILPQIERVVGDRTKVISYQNGLDTERMLAESFDPDNVFRAVINYAGECKGRGHIKMTFFNGSNYIGPVNGGDSVVAQEIADMLTAASLDCKATEDIRSHVWEKVVLNAALSPLCAATGKTMKTVMDAVDTYDLVESLLMEAIAVAKADGCTFGQDFFEKCISYLRNAGDHKPSMLIDIECKRPTEIAFINCKVQEYGRRYGIPTPYNDFVVKLVRFHECAYMDPVD
jgi:2-dehydropantoate 2-reductase